MTASWTELLTNYLFLTSELTFSSLTLISAYRVTFKSDELLYVGQNYIYKSYCVLCALLQELGFYVQTN